MSRPDFKCSALRKQLRYRLGGIGSAARFESVRGEKRWKACVSDSILLGQRGGEQQRLPFLWEGMHDFADGW